MIKDTVRRIAELQLSYSSENTTHMSERGVLIRQTLTQELKEHFDTFKTRLGSFAKDLSIEGKDGIGRKTEAPWVRLYSKELSPSATTGYYVVIHFSIDGQRCYVTIGCASTKWNNESGDLTKHSIDELRKKTAWARDVIEKGNGPSSRFKDKITLGARAALPKSFEDATALAELHYINQFDEQAFLDSINDALSCLRIIYDSTTQLSDLPNSEISESEIEGIINPNRVTSGGRQGFGLNAKEKKQVELRAMNLTEEHLKNLGYSISDTSKNNPYDFLAQKNGEAIKVEVKGTTSSNVDSVTMTHNEVNLHIQEKGKTALAIVSGIKLTNRGENPTCEGGTLEFINGWDIEKWIQKPITYQVFRP
jgi:hypothetical protein